MMTEANLRLSWSSLHKSGEVCTQFQEKTATYTFCNAWCNLHRSQFNEACTQFDEKPVVHLPR